MVSLVRQEEGHQCFSFQHRIASGASKEEYYGLVIARDCQLPDDLLNEADRMARTLQQRSRLAESKSKGRKAVNRRVIVAELEQTLQKLSISPHSSNSALRRKLTFLQAAFIKDMNESLPSPSEEERSRQVSEELELDSSVFYSDYRMIENE